MRSGLTIRAPVFSVIASMRPSTCAGTPVIMVLGAVPRRAGQFARTRSWFAPMPPEVTTTTGAFSSNSPTTVRELALPRETLLGSRKLAEPGRDGVTLVVASPLATPERLRPLYRLCVRGLEIGSRRRLRGVRELTDPAGEIAMADHAVLGGTERLVRRRARPGGRLPPPTRAHRKGVPRQRPPSGPDRVGAVHPPQHRPQPPRPTAPPHRHLAHRRLPRRPVRGADDAALVMGADNVAGHGDRERSHPVKRTTGDELTKNPP